MASHCPFPFRSRVTPSSIAQPHSRIIVFNLFLVFLGRIPSLDVGFLVDSSDAANWQKMLTAVLAIGDNLDISQSGTHIGFISYSSSASVAVPFPAADSLPYNPNVVRQLVNSVAPLGGSERKVDRALQIANDELFVSRNGSRKASKQVCQGRSKKKRLSYFVAIIIT